MLKGHLPRVIYHPSIQQYTKKIDERHLLCMTGPHTAASEALGQLGQDEPASGMALEPLVGPCPYIGQCGHWNTSSELKQRQSQRESQGGAEGGSLSLPDSLSLTLFA